MALLGTVIDDVAMDGNTAKTDGEFVADPAGVGLTGEEDDAVHDVVDEAIGNIHAAIGGDVQPHLVEIGLGEFREAKALHRAARRFEAFNAARRLRPRAFTRAASLDRDARSCSVYVPREVWSSPA